jgi:uncharacterized protein (DUF1015 family)
MADVQPFRALHYDLAMTGGLTAVIAPPYDVIDGAQRTELERRSPYNVVRIDLPRGADPYQSAARQLAGWRDQGVIVQDPTPALWVLAQDYTGPDGRRRTRTGFLARVHVDEYGPGRIRPHERTHPGAREDRLRLTRATKANLSPILALFSDATGAARATLERTKASAAWACATDDNGTVIRLWRLEDQAAIGTLKAALAGVELLIADGHHRYETARAYAEEVGGAGDHRYVLMCLVALEDPGLTVFPTHRLLRDLSSEQRRALDEALARDFDAQELEDPGQLAPPGQEPDRVALGYIDSWSRRLLRLTLRDPSIADAALPGHAKPYRRLDTAILEALLLKGALRMGDEDIDRLVQLDYARSASEAIDLVQSGRRDAAFLMAPTPVALVQEVAAAGETMPPKSTYFYPKVPTGLVFNPLEGG